MHKLTSKLAYKCLTDGIIEENEIDWFIYGLEKRFATLISSIFFLIIAMHISNLWIAISYLGSFYFLRVRTNGYHAKNIFNCLALSALIEIVLLIYLLPQLTEKLVVWLNIASLIVIFSFAPYNHPNMHLSEEEILGCRTSARIRISILNLFVIIFYVLGITCISNGITLGNTMAALLLVIAKIIKEIKL